MLQLPIKFPPFRSLFLPPPPRSLMTAFEQYQIQNYKEPAVGSALSLSSDASLTGLADFRARTSE